MVPQKNTNSAKVDAPARVMQKSVFNKIFSKLRLKSKS